MLKKFLPLIVILMGSISCFAQPMIENSNGADSSDIIYDGPAPEPNAPRPIVNTCGYYKFVPLDTMYYTVQSKDSIVIDYGTPLLKRRHEVLRVMCDSIGTENKHFYLNFRLVAFQAEECELGGDTVTHTDSDWLGRMTYIEIDSVGNRYSVAYDDTTKLGLTPGGAFQPYMFFNFKKPCSDTGQSYNVAGEYDLLVENGLPCPVLRCAYLFNNRGRLDTLGCEVNRLDFVKTAQGSITYPDPKQPMRVTNIVAGSGTMDIGIGRQVPIHFYQTQEQKLTIHLPNDVEKPGKQFTTSYFTLDFYREYQAPKKSGKSKKIKKSKKK